MDELQKIILAVLMKTLSLTADDAKALFLNADGSVKADAQDAILQSDVKRITALKAQFEADKQTLFNDGHKKGKAESLTKVEKSFKEKHKITSDKPFEEMLDEAMLAKSDLTKVPEEEIKKLPVYSNLEREHTELKNSFDAKVTEAETRVKTEYAEKDFRAGLKKSAIDFILTLDPLLPTDEKKKQRQLELSTAYLDNLIVEEMTDAKGEKYTLVFEKSADGSKGKRLENEHGKPLDITDVHKQRAEEFFEFPTAENRSSAGAGGNGNNNSAGENINIHGKNKGQAKNWNLKKPGNDNEYMQQLVEIRNNTAGLTSAEVAEKQVALTELHRGK